MLNDLHNHWTDRRKRRMAYTELPDTFLIEPTCTELKNELRSHGFKVRRVQYTETGYFALILWNEKLEPYEPYHAIPSLRLWFATRNDSLYGKRQGTLVITHWECT